MELKPSVILYPSMGMGHIIPMVELAKLFIQQNFPVTIVLIQTPTSSTMDPFITRVSSLYPSISFHRLPIVTPSSSSKHPLTVTNEIIGLANPHLLQFLESVKISSNIFAVVLDMFCSRALPVAEQLSLPRYFFFSSSAASLTAFLLLPHIQSQHTESFKELGDTPIDFPGLPSIPASDLPTVILEGGENNDALMSHFVIIPRADGIMINTFGYLEKRALHAIVNGDVRLPGGMTVPPVYCIGPLIGSDREEGRERHDCLSWLDEQPEKSVVFLCFGSMGKFSVEQLKEIAIGLERSGQRFLWVVRNPTDNAKVLFARRSEPDLDALLPEGFLERTRDQGMVLKTWAPQAAVLGHKSVGAFVSHCGWNSTLEAVSLGVPIIAWPLYAEQRMNKIFLVDEVKIAVGIEGYDKGLVSAEEIAKKIKWLMETEDGMALRVRTIVTAGEAAAARKEGGNSTLAFLKLVKELSNQ